MIIRDIRQIIKKIPSGMPVHLKMPDGTYIPPCYNNLDIKVIKNIYGEEMESFIIGPCDCVKVELPYEVNKEININ